MGENKHAIKTAKDTEMERDLSEWEIRQFVIRFVLISVL